jgi:integrase
MKPSKARYQQGSISKLPRSSGGFVWKVRFSEHINGKRHQKSLIFDGIQYPTERDVRKALEPTVVRVNAGTDRSQVESLFGTIIEIYRVKHLPSLEHSTRQTNAYLMDSYIEPKWWKTGILDVKPLAVMEWMQELGLAPSTKANIRSVMSQCFELAALHEYIPSMQRNPMSLVKIKGSSKRQKKVASLTIEQFLKLLESLPEPLNIMTLVAGDLGLRVSEAVALKWEDIDWKKKEISIQRKFTRGKLGPTKTVASEAALPLDPGLLKVLKAWKPKTVDSEWLFPSRYTGGPRSASMLLEKGIQPAAKKLGIGHIGWHTLRHACRSWLGGSGAPLTTQKDLLRHSDIDMTMAYGKTLPKEMRKAHDKVARKLVPKSMLETARGLD